VAPDINIMKMILEKNKKKRSRSIMRGKILYRDGKGHKNNLLIDVKSQ
jgi:hypothetical protein